MGLAATSPGTFDGAILFRTSADSLTASELRTGTEGSEYRVAFEIGGSGLKSPTTGAKGSAALAEGRLLWRHGGLRGWDRPGSS